MSAAFEPLGRILFLVGALLAAIGLVLLYGPRVPWLGRLPGDLAIHRDGFSFYIPLSSSILVSVFVSLIFWLIGRFRH